MSSLSQAATSSVEKRTNARYWIVVMLFIVTSLTTATALRFRLPVRKYKKISALIRWEWGMCSAFSWAYVIGQIPGGWLLDRFGSKRVYFWSIHLVDVYLAARLRRYL